MGKGLLRNKQGLTEEEFLKEYDGDRYEKPSMTVDMVIFTIASDKEQNIRKLDQQDLQILLIKRGDHPSIGQWALPGGFVNINESLDEAAKRELKEETNIENIYMEQLYTYGKVHRDPRARVVSCAYMSLVDRTQLDVKAGDDAADAKWFSVSDAIYLEEKEMTLKGYVLKQYIKLTFISDEEKLWTNLKITKTVEDRVSTIEREIIENNGIAFDHADIIQYGIKRLRNKIEYTDIAFNLMPPVFTLSELQQVYEIIIKKELHKSNFRREMEDKKKMVIKTNNTTKSLKDDKAKKAVRPSALYKFNPHWDE